MSESEAALQKEAEERQAWDKYAAAYLAGRVAGKEGSTAVDYATQQAALFADALLELRKERF